MRDPDPFATIQRILDPTWYALEFPAGSSKNDFLALLDGIDPSNAPRVHPFVDTGWIASRYLADCNASALDTLLTYVRELLPQGLTPHPMVNGALYHFLNFGVDKHFGSIAPDFWIWHLLANRDGDGRRVVPFLDSSLWQLLPLPHEQIRSDLLSRFFLARQREQNLSPHPWFDPLFVNSQRSNRVPVHGEDTVDVACEYRFYVERALQGEPVSPSAFFDEAHYVSRHEDARVALERRQVISGFQYYVMSGEPPRCTSRPGYNFYLPRPSPGQWSSAGRRAALAQAGNDFHAELERRLEELELPAVHLTVEGQLPPEIYAGEAVDLLVQGSAASPAGPIARILLRIGDEVVSAPFDGLPRANRAGTYGTAVAPADQLFCAFAVPWHGRFARAGEAVVSLQFEVLTARGPRLSAVMAVGTLTTKRRPILKRTARPASVQIAMATYNPDPRLFQEQIRSIRAQSFEDWHLHIADESDHPSGAELLFELTRTDKRITVSSGARRGVLGNFERALRQVDVAAPYFAFADQDDSWHPEKLEVLTSQIEHRDADLIFCDMDVRHEDGRMLAGSFWGWRHPHSNSFEDLLAVNSVTGAAMLARSTILKKALPFPHGRGIYHDMWIALVASQGRGIAYIERVLQTYIQHSRNVLGHGGESDDELMARHIQLETIELEALADKLLEAKKSNSANGNALARLTLNLRWPELLTLLDHTITDTLPRQLLSAAITSRFGARPGGIEMIRQLNSESFSTETAEARRRLYLGVPEWLEAGRKTFELIHADLSLQLQIAQGLAEIPQPAGVERCTINQSISTHLKVTRASPYDVTILIPELWSASIEADLTTKLYLAQAMQQEGARVRLAVTHQHVIDYKSLARIECACPRLGAVFSAVDIENWTLRTGAIGLSESEIVIATDWRTAHLAVRLRPSKSFLYLIGDYEPLSQPQGTWSAMAARSYDFRHDAIFSTEILQTYFKQSRKGVFSPSARKRGDRSISFTPVVDQRGQSLRVLEHISRSHLLCNFGTGVDAAPSLRELLIPALALAIPQIRKEEARRQVTDRCAIIGVGGGLGCALEVAGEVIKIMPSLSPLDFDRLQHNIRCVISPRHTPHPGIFTLYASAAGTPVLTTEYEWKSEAALRSLSERITAVPPTIEGLASGIVNLYLRPLVERPKANARGEKSLESQDLDIQWIMTKKFN